MVQRLPPHILAAADEIAKFSQKNRIPEMIISADYQITFQDPATGDYYAVDIVPPEALPAPAFLNAAPEDLDPQRPTTRTFLGLGAMVVILLSSVAILLYGLFVVNLGLNLGWIIGIMGLAWLAIFSIGDSLFARRFSPRNNYSTIWGASLLSLGMALLAQGYSPILAGFLYVIFVICLLFNLREMVFLVRELFEWVMRLVQRPHMERR